MPELRWALLIVGLLFLAGLAWWEMRRPRRGLPRADARPELHTDVRATRQEPSFDSPPAQRTLHAALGPDFELPQMRAHDISEPDDDAPLPGIDVAEDVGEVTLGGAAGDLLDDPAGDPVAHAAADPARDAHELDEEVHAAAGASPARAPNEEAARPAWPADGERRILALRVVPQSSARFGGRSLRQALEDIGYVHGVYGIYHHSLDDGRVLSSAANLTRPGNFDTATMDTQFFHGLNLFAVLPGPLPAEQTLDELAADAGELAQKLDALVQDDVGRPLTGARLAELKSGLSQGPGATP